MLNIENSKVSKIRVDSIIGLVTTLNDYDMKTFCHLLNLRDDRISINFKTVSNTDRVEWERIVKNLNQASKENEYLRSFLVHFEISDFYTYPNTTIPDSSNLLFFQFLEREILLIGEGYEKPDQKKLWDF